MLRRQPTTKNMLAGTFKAKCSAILDEVRTRRETVVITKRGKPVAKLVPISAEANDIYGFVAGKGRITGDVISPALTPKGWAGLA
jgi:prevent-host-death family protein